MVFSLAYSSTTDHDWTQEELVGLLTWSRAWNAGHGVTGLLLYRDCVFMQVLEGDEDEVRDLFAHIVADRRHQDVELLWTDHAPDRRFADWSMAFRELADHPVLAPGYRRAVPASAGRARSADEVGGFWSMFRPD